MSLFGAVHLSQPSTKVLFSQIIQLYFIFPFLAVLFLWKNSAWPFFFRIYQKYTFFYQIESQKSITNKLIFENNLQLNFYHRWNCNENYQKSRFLPKIVTLLVVLCFWIKNILYLQQTFPQMFCYGESHVIKQPV